MATHENKKCDSRKIIEKIWKVKGKMEFKVSPCFGLL